MLFYPQRKFCVSNPVYLNQMYSQHPFVFVLLAAMRTPEGTNVRVRSQVLFKLIFRDESFLANGARETLVTEMSSRVRIVVCFQVEALVTALAMVVPGFGVSVLDDGVRSEVLVGVEAFPANSFRGLIMEKANFYLQ